MTTKVRDLRARLIALFEHGGAPMDPTVNELLEILATLDDMNLEAFFRRLRGNVPKGTQPSSTAKVDVPQIVSRLKSAMPNDDAFHRAMDALAHQKGVTKLVLTQVFHELFGRTQGVPKKATRAELLRLIEDERNIVVRNEKMGQMLGRRPVPAE